MTVSLDLALSGLRAAQKSMDVVANNISNASTPGYTRKNLPLETVIIGGEGHGVTMGAVTRTVDKVLQHDLIAQTGISQAQATTQKYLDRIADFNGPAENGQSLSAAVSNLSQSFTALSSAPDSTLSLAQTLASAQQLASKFNSLSATLTQLRNQAEGDIKDGVTAVNQALQTVASINTRIAAQSSSGQSVADLQDQRDAAVRVVAQYLQVNAYESSNGTVTLLTKQGQLLADTTAQPLSFQPANLLPTSYYPGGGANGIFVNGTDIAGTDLGGSIGALLTLRDQTLPTYNAQADELAQKLAFRMNQQGLKLFVDASGNVPLNGAAPPAVVPYVGFAANIKVNTAVVANPALIRTGTNGNPVLAGSNEIIRKISQFAFGPFAGQTATGTAALGAGTVYALLGLQQINKLTGNTSITTYTPALVNNTAIAPGAQFTIDAGSGAQTITIGPADTAITLVNNINAVLPGVASLNGLGQLVLNSSNTITIADTSIGAAGMAALGFSFGAYPPQNPSFTVQVGTQAPVTISISPVDTPATLLANLNLVAGLSATLNGANQLVLAPIDGGNITLTDGPGTPVAKLGMTITNTSQTPFRQTALGPDGSLTTGLLANATVEDFARSIITGMSADDKNATDSAAKEQSFLQTLDKRNGDVSGVNIDEEMANMIRIQSNYAAAAKMISSAEKMMDDLMNAF